MRRALRPTLALALLAAAGCGDDPAVVEAGAGGGEEPAVEGPSPAEGEVPVFIEVSHRYRSPHDDLDDVGEGLGRVPDAVVYADGTAFAPGFITLQYPGPAVHPVLTGTVDDATLEELRALVAASGIVDGGLDLGSDLGDGDDLPDAPTTRLVVVVDGVEHVVEAPGLGLGGDPAAAGTGPLTEAQRADRAAVEALVGAVTEAVSGAAEQPYTPERYRVVAGAPVEADPAIAPNRVAWPASLPEPELGRCTAVSGAEQVAVLEEALASATAITRWVVGADEVSLSVRALLPHEPACPETRG